MSNVKSLLLAACVMLCIDVSAVEIDVAAAQAAASRFLQSTASGKLRASVRSLRLSHVERSQLFAEKADFYVFNTEGNGAFVIVSGDDRAPEVLGYGEGTFDMDDVPCNLQWLLDQYRQQMDYLHAHPEARVQRVVTSQTVVTPLLCTQWAQGEPYWNQCPMYQGRHCYTGCGATAMAQVVRYWHYPSRMPAMDAYGYVQEGGGRYLTVPGLPGADMDWDHMLDRYAGVNYTFDEANAVASLMRYCGQAAHIWYDLMGTGLTTLLALEGMKLLGYYSGATVLLRDDFPDDEWKEKLQYQLEGGCPVIYFGHGLGSGHVFVIDGCQGDMFHLNLGWSGSSDGYYSLSAFVPHTEMNQAMLYEIFPENTGIIFSPRLYDASDVGSTSFTASWRNRTPIELVKDYTLHVQIYDPAAEGPIPSLSPSAQGDDVFVKTGLTVRSCTVSHLSPGTSYCYFVVANMLDGTTKKSKANVVTLLDGPVNDVNGDGEVTVADVDELLRAIQTNAMGVAYDMNGDGEVNIADVNALIDEILRR